MRYPRLALEIPIGGGPFRVLKKYDEYGSWETYGYYDTWERLMGALPFAAGRTVRILIGDGDIE